ncbi:oxidoreductase [Rhodococcus rhodnii]|uniref:Oxidoreductase n=1 Tax=Rhodococcus rhodnii TaxID=38312 RepID=A0A6P2CN51_9NOCA|nr:oxidoreductase [Rhodococcus rhodnii]
MRTSQESALVTTAAATTVTDVDAVVHARRDLTPDIAEISFRPHDSSPHRGGAVPFHWEAGAHVDVVLRDPESGAQIVRQYSLCTDDSGLPTVAILREPGGRGGSVLAHTLLVPGAEVTLRGPRNHFPLVRAAGYVFVAGGIGITATLALAEAAAATGRPWRLVYTGHGRDRMAYADDLVARYGDHVVIHDSTVSGRIDLADAIGTPEPGTAVYCCGPAGLLEATAAWCEPIPAVDVFAERFVPREQDAPARTTPFDVQLTLSGRTLTVSPERSILDVAEEAGVVVVSSCREGTCGTCETDVVVGEIDHRDSVLTPEERAEGETMMICVSRACGARLVLEL